MHRHQLALLLTLVAVLLVVGAVWRVTTRPPELQVTVAAASRGTILREVLTSGTLEPAEAVDVGSQISGTVQSLHADFNYRVKAGQVIAQLDPAPYDTALAQARAGLIQAESEAQRRQIEAADTQVKASRARELAAKDLITGLELEAAQLAEKQAAAVLAAARAEAAAAKAAVAEAEVNRSRTAIRAPIDGVVVNRSVEVGQTLAASFQSPVLFRIANLKRMELRADVGEAEVGGVQAGTPVTFSIEALGDRRLKGTIAEVRLQAAATVATAGAGSSSTPTGTSGSTSASPSPATGTNSSSSSAAAASTSGSRSSPSTTTTTTTTTPAATPAAPSGAVMSYTAIVEVPNPDDAIAPGATAVVTLPTSYRQDVVRVPNTALAFRPTPDMLQATGQKSLDPAPRSPESNPTTGRPGHVWKYEAGKFVRIDVRTGVSDERWTELLEGAVQPGDSLVTAAGAPR